MRVTKAAYPSTGTTLVAPSSGLDIEGVHSLEVRWIFPGRLPAAVAGWFGRFPAQAITLEDAYLVDPYTPGLSVKIRERRALEIKVYHGSPGLIEMPGRAYGRLESWQKWSFPYDPADRGDDDPVGWRTVRKRRRICRFSRADESAGESAGGSAVARFPEPGEQPGCAVELAEFRALDEDWWTLGFEATFPADELRGSLEAAAALIFAQALPGGAELGMDASMSYARWLRAQPGIGDNPEAR
jgi:hypothetical protein